MNYITSCLGFVANLTTQDTDIWEDTPTLHYIRTGNLPEDTPTNRLPVILARSRRYRWEDDKLFFVKENCLRHEWRICPPPSDRDELVKQLHTKLCHVGVKKTFAALKQNYYWAGFYKHVEDVLRNCEQCSRANAITQPHPNTLNSLPIVGIWGRLSVDLTGPFDTHEGGPSYAMVCIDNFTKYTIATPLNDKSADETSVAMLSQVFSYLGIPHSILHDGGREWKGAFQLLCQQYGIIQRTTSAGHPSSNGLCEKQVSVIRKMISKYAASHPAKQWYKILPYAMLAVNTAVQRATQYSPYFLMFGRQPLFHANMAPYFREPILDMENADLIANVLLARSEILRRHIPKALGNLLMSQATDQRRYEHRRSGEYQPQSRQKLAPGDFVFVHQQVKNKVDMPASKLILKVIAIRRGGVVVLEDAVGDQTHRHITKISRCHAEVKVPDGLDEDQTKTCSVCLSGNSDSSPLLLCDKCPRAYHLACLPATHALASLPPEEETWECPQCAPTVTHSGSATAVSMTPGQTPFIHSRQGTDKESFAAYLQALLPGKWIPQNITKLYKLSCASITGSQLDITQPQELTFLYGALDFSPFTTVLDPFAGTNTTATTLEPYGLTVVTNDSNPDTRVQHHRNGLDSESYTGVMAPRASTIVITSPWYAVLDLAVPLLAQLFQVICVHVPPHYLTNGPAPRYLWLQKLLDADRARFLRIPHRNPSGHHCLWLIIAIDSQMLRKIISLAPVATTQAIIFHLPVEAEGGRK